jgi:hypothetical protein
MPGGRPKSDEPLIERFMKRVTKTDTCWLWTGSIQKNGYGSLSAKELTWGTRFAHRWSYVYHKGAIPVGKMIRHTCDVRNCVNPSHLISGDSIDNVHDMLERNPRGCGRKFREEDIQKIRADYVHKSYKELADEWGVCKATIGNIISGKFYSYM